MIVITTCTNKKKTPVEDRLEARNLAKGTLKEISHAWRTGLKEPRITLPANEMYLGRAFLEARRAHEIAGGELWIISAGLGLVRDDEKIPGYDLTISGGSPNSIRERILDGNFTLAAWWSEINRLRRPKRSVSALLAQNPRQLVLIAASSSYFQLIQQDLLSATDAQLQKVRIIGCESTDNIDDRLRPYVMPYADSLDGEGSPIPGTKADLPQRALYHFASEIAKKAPKASAEEHSESIRTSLAHVKQQEIPQRQRMSDDEIVSSIIEYWDEAGGKSQEMLKVLRKKKGIACEQSRFGRLFKVAKRSKVQNGQNSTKTLILRAIQTTQGNGVKLFAFFIPGELITQIADISRIHRNEGDNLEGFQRKEIKRHVNSIVEYLDQENVLFPNSITLALSPDVDFKFKNSRGQDPEGSSDTIHAGTLHIPIYKEGERVAWIVDGQQRSLALAKTQNKELNVPVVAFVASDLDTQREQFILVNKARPLPTRLINELLPEVDTHLPRDLSARKIPSALCSILNRDPDSPFRGLIKQLSQEDIQTAVITDTAIVEMIRSSLSNPLGILAQYKGFGSDSSDTDQMRKVLLLYWGTVKEVFPEAWGKTPQESRLMHSAGIRAMGTLMDKIMVRAFSMPDPKLHVRESLERIAPQCCWTEGVWDHIGLPWNEIQQTTRHVRLLSDVLTRLDYEMAIQRSLL